MTLHSISEREGHDRRAGTYDVRDWSVKAAGDETTVGKVRDVLVDENGEPRYADVDLGIFQKRVLVPFDRIAQDPGGDVIWVSGIDSKDFEDVPDYNGDIAELNADLRAGLMRDDLATGTRQALTAGAAIRSPHATTPGKDSEEETERVVETRSASPRGNSRLARLGELPDYEVADDEPDVRGWEVLGSDQSRVGSVTDLVVDTAAMKVRYLDVELDESFRRSHEQSRVLIPISCAEIIADRKVMRLDRPARQIEGVSAHRNSFDRDYEHHVIAVFAIETPVTTDREH